MAEEMSPFSPRPVFLIGAMRSGTTLLCELLNAHPNLAIFCESFIFRAMHLMRWDFRRGRLDDDLFATRFVEFLFEMYNPYGHGWRPIFQFLDSTQVRAQLINSDRSPRSLVAGVLSAFATREGAKHWGDKSTPQRAVEITTMHKLFPEGRFIHIYRDPRAVVNSHLAVGWARNVGYATNKWKCQISSIRRGLACIPKEQVTQVSYEALCASPELTLRSLCEFLGEDYNAEMVVRPCHLSPTVENLSVESIKHNVGGRILKGNYAKWRQGLSEQQVKLVERMAGRQMRKYGYECPRSFSVTGGLWYRLRRLQAIRRRYNKLRLHLP
jgi:hypothetical protein